MQETQVRSTGQEDPLKQGLAAHSSTLAWRISWTEEPGGLQSLASESDTTERLNSYNMLGRHGRLSSFLSLPTSDIPSS